VTSGDTCKRGQGENVNISKYQCFIEFSSQVLIFTLANMSGQRAGLTYKKLDLDVPSLEEVSQVLQKGLSQHFQDVDVSVVQCPDLKQKPFNLAHNGLCGNEKIADVGGPPYLIPLVQRDKVYSLKDIASVLEMGDKAFLLGASAGPFNVVGVNSELMPNVSFEKNQTDQTLITNRTHFAKVFILFVLSIQILSITELFLDLSLIFTGNSCSVYAKYSNLNF